MRNFLGLKFAIFRNKKAVILLPYIAWSWETKNVTAGWLGHYVLVIYGEPT